MEPIERAIAMALRAHAGQLDKAGLPYILHPLRVAMKFIASDPLFIIAILHDVIEDTKGQANEITSGRIALEFGVEIADAVKALSRRGGEGYLSDFIPRCKQNELARLVKIADIHDNLDPARVLAIPNDAGRMKRIQKYHRALEILKGAE